MPKPMRFTQLGPCWVSTPESNGPRSPSSQRSPAGGPGCTLRGLWFTGLTLFPGHSRLGDKRIRTYEMRVFILGVSF